MTTVPIGKTNININLDEIDDFKCVCGHTEFLMAYQLKWISPLLCGDPTGGKAHIGRFRCGKCGRFYPGALSPEKVEAIRLAEDNGKKEGELVDAEFVDEN